MYLLMSSLKAMGMPDPRWQHEQAKQALQKQAEDDEQLLASTEAMMQQLQASLTAARQDVMAHQASLAGCQSTADALRVKLEMAERDIQAQQATSIKSIDELEAEVQQVRQQLQRAKDSLATSQASVLSKQTHISELQAALQSGHLDQAGLLVAANAAGLAILTLMLCFQVLDMMLNISRKAQMH